jgi:DNA repair photolyase
MNLKENYNKGRGAQINTPNPFAALIRHKSPNEHKDLRTKYLDTHAKSILNKVDSPDIGMSWSMNPYQGCEHGCVYCYARNTHTYWGYSAGLDFESVILVKKNAPALLAKKLKSKRWKPEPIMLSGNTDCYQPIEKTLKITRRMLEVLWQFRHPVGIITKNRLILRDIDLLEKLNSENLVKVAISINTMNETLRQKLEPRTATIARRIETIKELSAKGIPVNVMVAPIIPGLNDHEIFNIIKSVAKAGAINAYPIVIRLNGDVRQIFEDWLHKNFPDRAKKVIRKIESLHGGKTSDSRFGTRMKGEGRIADSIKDQFALAKKLYLEEKDEMHFNLELYNKYKQPQLSLFA